MYGVVRVRVWGSEGTCMGSEGTVVRVREGYGVGGGEGRMLGVVRVGC